MLVARLLALGGLVQVFLQQLVGDLDIHGIQGKIDACTINSGKKILMFLSFLDCYNVLILHCF